MLLSELANNTSSAIHCVDSNGAVGQATLRRLVEIGFIPGEPVTVQRRGPGGREPLVVQIGNSQFALRLAEAQCIHVLPPVEREG